MFALLEQPGIVGRIESGRKIIVLQLAIVGNRKELEALTPATTHERIDWLRGDEHDRRHLALAHLFQRNLMRDECLLHVETEAAEDQRPRISRGCALRVEIHLLADKILETLDLRPDEDMQ